jgi:hypothetical protein
MNTIRMLGFILSLLLAVRAHIPNQPGFGPGSSDTSDGTSVVRSIAALLIAVAFLSAVLWMAVRLVIGFS